MAHSSHSTNVSPTIHPTSEAVIDIEDLHTEIGGKAIHTGVDLKIYRNETLVIIGGSGQGKSVLLRHILGFIRPTKGRILIFGKNIFPTKTSQQNDVYASIGVLFQGGALFDSLSVGENVAFQLMNRKQLSRETIRTIVEEKLEMVGLRGIADKRPGDLSLGMVKRVALARAIASDPQIIFYDEPTTGIDPILADAINELILKLQHQLGITSVVVTHDLKSAFKVGNRIAMLHNGQITFVGTIDEFIHTNNPYVQEFIKESRYLLNMDDPIAE